MWASPGSNIEQKNEKVPGNICRMSYSRLCCQRPAWLLAIASFSLDKIQIRLPFCLGSWELQFSRQRPWLSNESCIYVYFGVGGFTNFLLFILILISMWLWQRPERKIIPPPAYFPDSYYHCDHLRDASERLDRYILKKLTLSGPRIDKRPTLMKREAINSDAVSIVFEIIV